MTIKVIDTDVLVIGSGAAGLRAAIEARRRGVEVLLASKSVTGLTSCSVFSGGFFTAPVGKMTKEDHLRMTIVAGKYMNDQRLVEVLVDEAMSRLLELKQYGVKLAMHDGGCRVINGAFPTQGAGLINPLTKYAKAAGVKMLESTMITDLSSDETVNGASGFIVLNGRRIMVNAKAVVLATGGAGQTYRRNDNPVRMTGDGYVMAYEMGLPLIGMEFIQCLPIGCAEAGYPMFMLLLPPSILECGVLQNIHGEDIVKKYSLDPKLAYSTHRDAWTITIAKEVQDGKGEDDTILLNLTNLPKGLQEHRFVQFLSELFKSFPVLTKPLHVTPLVHTFLGGVQIDDECRTGLPGLFAAGEVTGGIHGANLVGGNALTECIVYGARAGQYAAEYAKTTPKKQADKAWVEQKLEKISEIERREPSNLGNAKLVKSRIKKIMWEKAGIIRSQRSLAAAQAELTQLGDENLPKIYGKKPYEVREALEATNLFIVASLVVEAALVRKESRGAHYRDDYPDQDDKRWLKHVVLTKKTEGTGVRTRPVIMTKLFP